MENSSSSSSSGTTQHQILLTTVMELKGDLEVAMNKMLVMDEQNRSLSHNYSQLKEELIETRRKYNECRENYLSTVADKLSEEERREEFNEKLKLQLLEKTKEFEALRDKFAPQDIDYIRIKVQEELEIPHRQRLQAMEEEVARHKENYFVMKRELESAKAAYEAYSQNQLRDVAAVREEHESVAIILREQIARLQESVSDAYKQLQKKTTFIVAIVFTTPRSFPSIALITCLPHLRINCLICSLTLYVL